jgi:hypothetical protein
MLYGEMDQLDGGIALEFAKDIGAVNVHGFVAEFELFGNRFHAQPVDQQIENLAFTRCQRLQGFRRLLTLAQRQQGIGTEIAATGVHGADRLHQLFRATAFGEIAARTGIQRTLYERGGVVNAQNDGAEIGALLP